jgi:hypothetical protein
MRAAADRNLPLGGSHAFEIEADTKDYDRPAADG